MTAPGQSRSNPLSVVTNYRYLFILQYVEIAGNSGAGLSIDIAQK